MAKEFADLKDPDSEFSKFLVSAAKYDKKKPEGLMVCDLYKLQILGFLWCKTPPKYKFSALYDLITDESKSRKVIGAHSKNFRKAFDLIIWMATDMIYEEQEKFMKNPSFDNSIQFSSTLGANETFDKLS